MGHDFLLVPTALAVGHWNEAVTTEGRMLVAKNTAGADAFPTRYSGS